MHIDDEEIKEEMIKLVDEFKRKAKSMQSNLHSDDGVINSISDRQDNVLTNLIREKGAMYDIMNIKGISFFRLLFMALAGLALWIYGMFFIIIS